MLESCEDPAEQLEIDQALSQPATGNLEKRCLNLGRLAGRTFPFPNRTVYSTVAEKQSPTSVPCSFIHPSIRSEDHGAVSWPNLAIRRSVMMAGVAMSLTNHFSSASEALVNANGKARSSISLGFLAHLVLPGSFPWASNATECHALSPLMNRELVRPPSPPPRLKVSQTSIPRRSLRICAGSSRSPSRDWKIGLGEPHLSLACQAFTFTRS